MRLFKKLKDDESGIVEIIHIAVILGIAVAAGSIVLFLTNSIVTLTGTPSGATEATASGTFTFSGNVSNGELVNITHPNGSVYRFEFNTTNGSTCLTTDCIPVNLTGVEPTGRWWNQSWYASGNLTAAINANATVASFVTAANTTNITTITADAPGAGWNSVVLSDNAANVASSGLSGGVSIVRSAQRIANASNNLENTIDTGYSFLPIVAVAAIGAIAIGFVFGLIPGMGRGKGRGGGGI